MLPAVIVALVGLDVGILVASVGSNSKPQTIRPAPPVTATTSPVVPATTTTVGKATTTTTSASKTTTAKPTVATTTTSTGPPQLCNPADGTITTTTDRTSYQSGDTVTATTTLRDTVSCIFQPHPTGQYDCGTSLVFDESSGTQVFPASGQPEQCVQPAPSTLKPGQTQSVSLTWPAVPSGQFTAVATWSWNGPSQPYTVNVGSAPFTVS